jgi:hypothetical protein
VTVYDAYETDLVAEALLGIQAFLGTIWWVVVTFVQIKNVSTNYDLQYISSVFV